MSLKISRILHAGYIFDCELTQIAFDPIFENPFSRNCYAFPEVRFDSNQIQNLKLDAVFISHFHDDHCSFDSLNLLNRDTPIYLYCVFDELFSLIRELGFKNVFPLAIDVPIRVGAFEVTPRRALDFEVDSIFQIQAGGMNLLNVVDSWIDLPTLDQLSKLGPWDMILWPFQTLREIEVLSPSRGMPPSKKLPPEWISQLQGLKPRYVVPSSCQFVQESWSWYNQALFPISYDQFAKEVEEALPDCQVVRMNPSVSLELNQKSLKVTTPLDWIQPIHEQNLDYTFVETMKPPSTGEISRNFEKLTEEGMRKLEDYCQTKLLEKYKSLGSADIYFKKPRHWRLSLFDHEGQPTHYWYEIRNEMIQRITPRKTFHWCTEVPMAKLFAAICDGESLTSMYMRINDQIFPAEIEKEVQCVELTEDPLVRCLFSGAFSSYQVAQLKRLTNAKAQDFS